MISSGKVFACTLLVGLATLSCALAGDPFNKINKHLVKTINYDDPIVNLAEAKKFLEYKLSHKSLFGNNKDLIEALTDVSALADKSHACDKETYETIQRNVDRSLVDGAKQRRIDQVLLEWRQQHARNCEKTIEAEVSSTQQEVDAQEPGAVSKVHELAKQVAKQMSQRTKSSRLVQSPDSTQDLDAAMSKKSFGKDDGDVVYWTLFSATRDSPDELFEIVYKGKRNGAGERMITRDLAQQFYERNLLAPCRAYRAKLGELMRKVQFEAEIAPKNSFYKTREFSVARTSVHLCGLLEHNSDHVFKEFLKLAQQKSME